MIRSIVHSFWGASLTLVAFGLIEAGAALDAEAIGAAAGTKATLTPDGVVRLAYSRNEITVHIDGVALTPFAGLTSWAAFTESGKSAMMMGDTVVFEDEVNAAMDAAFAAGLDVTALHNHFLHDTPKVYFMHIGAHGNAIDIAKGVKTVWDVCRAARAGQQEVAKGFDGAAPELSGIDAAPLEAILGIKPSTQDGVVKFTVGREGTMDGVKVGASMGLTTWAAFSGNDESAVMDGDFIMAANEVQPVLRALRAEKVNVVAIHNHMVGEDPAFYFVHFWGKGNTKSLAASLKKVLDAQAKVSDTSGKSSKKSGHK